MPKVAGIRCGLGANVPKLKRCPSSIPGLIKSIPLHPVGQGLAVLVLDQPGALDLRWAAGDAVDDLGKFACDFDGELSVTRYQSNPDRYAVTILERTVTS